MSESWHGCRRTYGSCSRKSRKSCPPSVAIDVNNLLCDDIKTKSNSKTGNKTKLRKKKDVIKVKIIKPQTKSGREIYKSSQSNTEISQSKSDQNGSESGIFLQDINDSIELNHNHSDTCLRANEYRENSVEFVENSTPSILSLNSSPMKQEYSKGSYDKNSQTTIFDVICNNACDVDNYANGLEGVETLSDTPLASISSLLTEDLSDETPVHGQKVNSKWYLLSEEETTNTLQKNLYSNTAGYGANLEQIFPVMCAVPNLSSITEISRETDQSIRKRLETDSCTINNLD